MKFQAVFKKKELKRAVPLATAPQPRRQHSAKHGKCGKEASSATGHEVAVSPRRTRSSGLIWYPISTAEIFPSCSSCSRVGSK
eukprot:scaffold120154_cov32-Tisochrysis_lutea.AAC.2